MPQKTRKQKILAEKRRSTLMAFPSFTVNTPIESNSSTQKVPSPAQLKYEQSATVTTQSVSHISDQTAVKHDLSRIGIFAFFAIAFQLVVYWLLRRG